MSLAMKVSTADFSKMETKNKELKMLFLDDFLLCTVNLEQIGTSQHLGQPVERLEEKVNCV